MHSSLQLCPYHFPSASHPVPTLDGLPVQEPNPHEGRTRHCKIISQLCTIISQHSFLAEFPLPSAASVVLRGTVSCIRTSVELSSQHTFFRLCPIYSMHPVATPSVSPYAMRLSVPCLPPLLLAYILFFFYCTDFQQLHSAPMFISHSSFTTLHLFTAHCHRLATLVPVRLVNVAISLHPVDSSLHQPLSRA